MIKYIDVVQKTHEEKQLTLEEQHWFRENLLRLRRALLFYANASNFHVSGGKLGVMDDLGVIARDALTALHKEA